MEKLETSKNIRELFSLLLEELNYTYSTFLGPNLTESPELKVNWERDKKSAIVFSHAALENYIEMLSLLVLENAHHSFIYDKRVSNALLSFLWVNRESKPKLNDDEWDKTNREYILDELESLVNSFKKDVNQNNHGIKIKNLNKLLRSVGLELPMKEKLLSSLNKLTDLRGEFAHRFLEKGNRARRISNVKGPEEIEETIINSFRVAYLLYLRSFTLIDCPEASCVVKNEVVRYLKAIIIAKENESNSIFTLD